ncbi:MAG: hypothetical protein JSS60_00250 [Verrucomicrobia bacterium]|nr:hypothetical protein [Verrucomicrobiota bacterium]
MSAPLTSLTQKPIQYSTFSFGGDDTQLGQSGLFGTVTEWDRNAKEDSFKSNVVFFLKKAFDFLDTVGIGTCVFGNRGFSGQLEDSAYYQTGLDRNKQAREKIVTALGGEAVCSRIPVVNLRQSDFKDYLALGDEYFRGGDWVVQGEDPAGRKFALLRLADRTGRIVTATVHQRYRETCINRISSGGSLWAVNFNGREGGDANTDRVADFVQQVRTMRHGEFTIAPKP